jgi:hypothetical protein
VDASFRAGAAAASVRIVGVVPVRGQPTAINLQTAHNDTATGSLTLNGTRVDFVVVDGDVYVRTSTRAGARLLDATVPKGVKIGWIRVQRPNPAIVALASLQRRFFGSTSAGVRNVRKGSVVQDGGQPAMRLVETDVGHFDVALKGPPFPVDLVLPGQGLRLRFDRWNRSIRITAPSHWTTAAAIRARRPAVRSISPPNGGLLPSTIVGGQRRFRAAGVNVEFDYPASFIPLKISSSRRAGNGGGADIAVGIGNDALLIVTQFSRLPIPVNTQNMTVLAPSFDRAIDAIAGHHVTERTSILAGHPLLSFGDFALSGPYGTRTLRAYNVFFGDTYDELQCQFTAQGRALGISACGEMLRTLQIKRTGPTK